jgi:hypothetical protein
MFARKPLNVMLSLALVAMAGAAQAASVPNTVPALPAGDAQELTSPFVLAPGYTQKIIADRTTQNTLVPGSNSGNWDMIDTNRTGVDAGRYLFMPFETSTAGVQRVDLSDTNYNTRTVTIVAPGTQGFKSGDASRWTPWGTYLTAEESWSDPTSATSSNGRLFEVTNPTTAAANGGIFEHRKITNADVRVSHEGLAFDKANNFYFIDERNDSHIFKFASANPNATNGNDFFSQGVVSVLRVGDGTTEEATGAYSWIALTDAAGNALPGTIVKTSANDATMTILDGRATPNEAAFLGTNFDRPEDMEIQTLANGDQRLYIATTTNDKVFSLDLAASEIDLFVDQNTIDAATGVAVGSVFNSPDNIAIAPDGTMYVIEDQDGGVANIWRALDANRDGVAESIDVFATLRTNDAEPTGMFFHEGKIFVNVQHPLSGNDALVEISPVPEAETYAMMLAGLGLVGFAARRRTRG